jgi:hypothetical protein
MAPAKVVVREVQVHLFPEAFNFLGKSNCLSGDAITVSSLFFVG